MSTPPFSETLKTDARLGCGPILPDRNLQTTSLRKQVFEYVRGHKKLARTEIANALSISAGSVTSISAELIGAGLIREVEDADKRATSRGRPRVALEVVSDSFHVIGINLSTDSHSAVLTDSVGNIQAQKTRPASAPSRSLATLIEEVAPLISELLSDMDMTSSEIAAIGIGISGVVDHRTGIVTWSPLITETNAALGQAIADLTGIPVLVDNDANIVTLAELWFGGGRTKPDFAVVTVEHGVGMGLVLNNRLFRGARGMGLELGHTKVQLGGALCRCGQRGCLEAYLGDYALTREAETVLDMPLAEGEKITLEQLSDEVKAGNAAAKAIFDRAGQYLTLGLANVVQLFDPALIILSGERMRYDHLYAEGSLEEVHKLTLGMSQNPCEIITHAWDGSVWARGASALALTAATEKFVNACTS